MNAHAITKIRSRGATRADALPEPLHYSDCQLPSGVAQRVGGETQARETSRPIGHRPTYEEQIKLTTDSPMSRFVRVRKSRSPSTSSNASKMATGFFMFHQQCSARDVTNSKPTGQKFLMLPLGYTQLAY